MNRFEFKEVLKQEGIRDTYSFTEGRYGEHEDVYYWKDLVIYFSGSYYTVVKGRIPKEVARKIYELDLLGDEYSIRFQGAERGRKIDDNHIYYHIDTFEGLLLFLEVYKNYLEDYIDRPIDLDSMVADIKKNLLKLSKANISNDEWVNKHNRFSDIYNSSVETNGNELLQLLRDKINEYDKTVNPFLNEDIDEITNTYDLSKMKLSVDYVTNECDLKITSEENKTENHFYRTNDGFHFNTSFIAENGDRYSCYHYFDKTVEGNCTGEIIKVSKDCRDNERVSYTFTYNITNGTFEFTDGHKIPAILEVVSQIIDELNRYINKAKSAYSDSIKDNKKLV